MNYVDENCWASGCGKPTTHTVTMLVHVKSLGETMTGKTGYCLEHAMYFAAWLPYCYPGEHELVSIEPPASELFPPRP